MTRQEEQKLKMDCPLCPYRCALVCSLISIQLSAFLRCKLPSPLQSLVPSTPKTWLFALCFLPLFLCMSNILPVPWCDSPAHHTPWALKAAFPWACFRGKKLPSLPTGVQFPPLLSLTGTQQKVRMNKLIVASFLFFFPVGPCSQKTCMPEQRRTLRSEP